jgi:hypothetical protein
LLVARDDFFEDAVRVFAAVPERFARVCRAALPADLVAVLRAVAGDFFAAVFRGDFVVIEGWGIRQLQLRRMFLR